MNMPDGAQIEAWAQVKSLMKKDDRSRRPRIAAEMTLATGTPERDRALEMGRAQITKRGATLDVDKACDVAGPHAACGTKEKQRDRPPHQAARGLKVSLKTAWSRKSSTRRFPTSC
jgi:hypothetical protein